MTYAIDRRSRGVLVSLVPVICPPEAVPLAEAIVDDMALTFAATPPVIQKLLPAGFLAYELGALPRYFRPASALTGAKAEAYFRSWERGVTPLHKQFARVINQLMSLSCYEQPAMMAAVGYHVEPWIKEVTKKRLTVYADDVRKQAAQILAPDPLRPHSKKEVA